MMKCRLRLIELIFVLSIGIPVGIILAYYNYQKIIFEVQFNPGMALANNFCNSLDFTKKYLYKDTDLMAEIELLGLSNRVFRVQPSNQQDNIRLSMHSNIKGLEKDNQDLSKLKDKIIATETSNFNIYYKDISLHCSMGINYLAFKQIPGKIIETNGSLRRRYNNIHLAVIFISPLVILLMITYLLKLYIGNRNSLLMDKEI